MKQYRIAVTNTAKMVLALIFVPLSVTPIMIGSALYFRNIPDWAVFAGICALLILAIIMTVAMVKKITPKAIVTLHDDSFSVDFEEKGFLIPRSFSICMSQVSNCYAEQANGLYYLSFKTTTHPSSFNIEACSRNGQDLISFSELMAEMAKMVERNNEMHNEDGQTIAAVTMYESWWAKVLIVFAILVFAGALFMGLFTNKGDETIWWRLSTILIFGAPFAYKIYYHNYKKKKK